MAELRTDELGQVLAGSTGERADSATIVFEVAEHFLAGARRGEWSQPCRFRFEERGDGRFDLVFSLLADRRT